MHMYEVCCEQETAFVGELYTEWCWSTVLITTDLHARLNGQENREMGCNCSCTWSVAYSSSHLWLHVACANAVLFLNQWLCTWILSFQNVTLGALLITAPLFFIYLWAVVLLQSVLFQSMKAWRPFSIHSLVLIWAFWDAVNGLLARTCSSIVIVLGRAFVSSAFWI